MCQSLANHYIFLEKLPKNILFLKNAEVFTKIVENFIFYAKTKKFLERIIMRIKCIELLKIQRFITQNKYNRNYS